jgi:hypothetical protein
MRQLMLDDTHIITTMDKREAERIVNEEHWKFVMMPICYNIRYEMKRNYLEGLFRRWKPETNMVLIGDGIVSIRAAIRFTVRADNI